MTKTVEEAKADLEAAKAAYLSALERGCERSEGSGAQERRNDERLEDCGTLNTTLSEN